jgi:pSer/pThr/pTyr-binding forkhead associated (FHA) protein
MYTPNIILLNEKKYFCISEDAYILGKSRDKCDGVIKASKAVSRIHCKFHHMENENYGVEDLQSANGMKINGYSIQTGMVYELHEGDVITLTDDSFTVSYVIIPDFLCLAKGLTNGLPLAVVLGPKNEILSMPILDILLITGTCLF